MKELTTKQILQRIYELLKKRLPDQQAGKYKFISTYSFNTPDGVIKLKGNIMSIKIDDLVNSVEMSEDLEGVNREGGKETYTDIVFTSGASAVVTMIENPEHPKRAKFKPMPDQTQFATAEIKATAKNDAGETITGVVGVVEVTPASMTGFKPIEDTGWTVSEE